mgnify:CR=1 FL=1
MTDFLLLPGLMRFSSSTEAVSKPFGGEIARGKHLFPFRTEPLSLSAPMVLGGQPPGRVGRRRSYVRAAQWAALLPPLRGRLLYAAIRSGVPARSCSGCGAPEARPEGRRSHSGTGSGSTPYSPRVAKSTTRSAASRTCSRTIEIALFMPAKLRLAPDGTARFAGERRNASWARPGSFVARSG